MRTPVATPCWCLCCSATHCSRPTFMVTQNLPTCPRRHRRPHLDGRWSRRDPPARLTRASIPRTVCHHDGSTVHVVDAGESRRRLPRPNSLRRAIGKEPLELPVAPPQLVECTAFYSCPVWLIRSPFGRVIARSPSGVEECGFRTPVAVLFCHILLRTIAASNGSVPLSWRCGYSGRHIASWTCCARSCSSVWAMPSSAAAWATAARTGAEMARELSWVPVTPGRECWRRIGRPRRRRIPATALRTSRPPIPVGQPESWLGGRAGAVGHPCRRGPLRSPAQPGPQSTVHSWPALMASRSDSV